MRVVSGDFKGRRIEPVPGEGTRPTAERVREAIGSSVLSNRDGGFAGARVLDAFAGSGALGIEALSRGAACCTFVDIDAKAVRTIEGNIGGLPISSGQARVIRGDFLSLIGAGGAGASRCYVAGAPFDVVLLDPPYRMGADAVASAMLALSGGGCLTAGALVVYEQAGGKAKRGRAARAAKKETPEEIAEMEKGLQGAFELVSVKPYGSTRVVYFRHAGS